MQSWKNFPRLILFTTLLISLLAGLSAPVFVEEFVSAAPMQLPLLGCPASTLAQWTFTNTVAPSTGAGIFSSGIGITPLPPGPYTFLGGTSIYFTNWNTATLDPDGYLEFQVDTSGQDAILFDFRYRSTGTGPNTLELHYSTDGTSFTFFSLATLTTNAAFHALSYDLSSISALDNNPNAKFRIYAYGMGGGNFGVDDVIISNICIPPTPTDTLTPTNTFTPTDTVTPSATLTPTNTLVFSLTPTLTPTRTFTPTRTLTPIPSEVVISEVAWSGTTATTNDEWIELYNPRTVPVDISGWRLINSNGGVDIVLSGTIGGNSFYLLERTADNTVRDVSADQIYTGLLLPDTGDILYLRKDTGALVDTANSDAGTWPAGSGSPNFYSMERVINGGVVAKDNSTGWITNNNPATWTGLDANNNRIHGTPGTGNWSFTVTPTVVPKPSGVRSVLINEIAWAGTSSSLTNDEWIELYNPGSAPINITGWSIQAADGEPNITLIGTIPARSYFLLERGDTVIDNTTVSDITADQIYTGNTLANTGESLKLYDGSNKIIDTANNNGGAWPKGSNSTYGSMERVGTSFEGDSSWKTNTGSQRNGLNANGGAILGTPRRANSQSTSFALTAAVPTKISTRTPTFIPPVGRPFINEFLPRPGFDWNQDGKVDVFDEFIEIKNVGNADINLNGWQLDDEADFEGVVSSTPYTITDTILKPGEYAVFYASETNLLLSDGGDSVRLFNPGGKLLDVFDYIIAKVEDESTCRLPDGNGFGSWFENCTPTPNLTNTRDGIVPSMPGEGFESPVCELPDTLPADFLFAECRGYGANIWDSFYWDEDGRQGDQYVPENMSKWESFVE